MSSSYRAICIEHDPPIELGEFRASTADGALSVGRDGPHANCELLVGRYSGALVEIGCPPPGAAHGYHPHGIAWADTSWLRVAVAAAHAAPNPAIRDALSRIPVCWRGQLAVLRPLLIDEEETSHG